jgi:hypothetical protein
MFGRHRVKGRLKCKPIDIQIKKVLKGSGATAMANAAAELLDAVPESEVEWWKRSKYAQNKAPVVRLFWICMGSTDSPAYSAWSIPELKAWLDLNSNSLAAESPVCLPSIDPAPSPPRALALTTAQMRKAKKMESHRGTHLMMSINSIDRLLQRGSPVCSCETGQCDCLSASIVILIDDVLYLL